MYYRITTYSGILKYTYNFLLYIFKYFPLDGR